MISMTKTRKRDLSGVLRPFLAILHLALLLSTSLMI